jgi:hypothetical protein
MQTQRGVAHAKLVAARVHTDLNKIILRFDRPVIVKSGPPVVRCINISAQQDMLLPATGGGPGGDDEMTLALPQGSALADAHRVILFIPEGVAHFASAGGGRVLAAMFDLTVTQYPDD